MRIPSWDSEALKNIGMSKSTLRSGLQTLDSVEKFVTLRQTAMHVHRDTPRNLSRSHHWFSLTRDLYDRNSCRLVQARKIRAIDIKIIICSKRNALLLFNGLQENPYSSNVCWNDLIIKAMHIGNPSSLPAFLHRAL